jgi:hypothetical protein
VLEKINEIEKYLIRSAEEYGLCDLRTEVYEPEFSYDIYLWFEPIDSDDPILNEFYVKFRDIFVKLGYLFTPVGDSVLDFKTDGVMLSLTNEQLEEFITTDIFRSIKGLNKFNVY